jgi:steroid 5-alpha reductase family enzyme
MRGLQLSFVIHAMVYAMVMLGLWRINSTTTQYDWASIVAWGWGMGLMAHGAVWMMFGRGGRSSRRRTSR